MATHLELHIEDALMDSDGETENVCLIVDESVIIKNYNESMTLTFSLEEWGQIAEFVRREWLESRVED